MKYLQSIITLLIVIFCSGTLVTSCMESNNKIDSAGDTVKAAKEKFEDDKDAFIGDMRAYKAEYNQKYKTNKKKIEELKNDKTLQVKDLYNEKVEELETKNENLKREMDTIEINSNIEWKNFKREFSHEMDELDQSIKSVTQKT